MKTWKIAILICAMAASFTACKKETETTATATSKTLAAGETATASFKIEGMSCAVMCASKIEKELQQTEGVKAAKVDFEKKTATVEYNSTLVTPSELAKKVEAVADGKTYKVSEVKSSTDKASLYEEEPKKAKKSKKSKKAAKEEAAKAETAAPAASCSSEAAKTTSKPGGCCASKKKSCSSESGTL
ncbi:heavy metal-associated domain-containing protein [Flavobacterium sp.]|uniref:heavy-metal-associated domain-containing protein n=1 Tax=Flavobacterium sp. TaxID=239 RepID=UPI00263108E4|nr:heavy metal-associated domain-containing protein [Flavobacterium sp.]